MQAHYLHAVNAALQEEVGLLQARLKFAETEKGKLKGVAKSAAARAGLLLCSEARLKGEGTALRAEVEAYRDGISKAFGVFQGLSFGNITVGAKPGPKGAP